MTNTMIKLKMWERQGWINIRQENADNSCLKRKTVSDYNLDFTLIFPIPKNPLPVQTVQITQLHAGKCWNFLFGYKNRECSHIEPHQCVLHPEKPILCNRHKSIKNRLENGGTSCLPRSYAWRFCILPFSILPINIYHRHNRHQIMIVLNNSTHGREDNSYKKVKMWWK